MLLLLAMVLSLTGTFWYYRAIIQFREHLDTTQPGRGSARKALAVDEILLVSNPIRMYKFLFRSSHALTNDHAALRKSRSKFITSLAMCALAAMLVGANVLLR